MGEKGNADLATAAAGMTAAGAVGSTIERTIVSTSETVIGVGQDLADTIREKSIGAVADETVAAARERLQGGELPPPAPADESPPET